LAMVFSSSYVWKVPSHRRRSSAVSRSSLVGSERDSSSIEELFRFLEMRFLIVRTNIRGLMKPSTHHSTRPSQRLQRLFALLRLRTFWTRPVAVATPPLQNVLRRSKAAIAAPIRNPRTVGDTPRAAEARTNQISV